MHYLLKTLLASSLSMTLSSATHAQDMSAEPSFAPALREFAESYEKLAEFQGVILVARGEKIVFQQAFGQADYNFAVPMPANARFRLASLSKQFTEAAIGRLADRGLLRLDDPLRRFLPDFPRGDEITIRQLLENKSGIKHTNGLAWLNEHDPMRLDDIVANLAREPLDFDPGTNYTYSNGGYAVLAAVIEKVSGTDFASFIESEVTRGGYPSVGHETPFEVIPLQPHRYAPGPDMGRRVQANEYLVANRIGGGSLYADATDVFRFFRDTWRGVDMSPAVHDALFRMPKDGDALITGRSSGTLAQVYYDLNDDLTVVMLSSNSAWPGGFTNNLVNIVRGKAPNLLPVDADAVSLSQQFLAAAAGTYKPERFRWSVTLRPQDGKLVWEQDAMTTAFVPMTDGSFFLPLWDWLCRFNDQRSSFTCRQRDPDSTAEFAFRKQPAE